MNIYDLIDMSVTKKLLTETMVSIYTVNLIRTYKMRTYDQSTLEVWKKSESFSLDIIQRIEFFVGILNITTFSIQLIYAFDGYAFKASTRIIYVLKMYLLILTWKDTQKDAQKQTKQSKSLILSLDNANK